MDAILEITAAELATKIVATYAQWDKTCQEHTARDLGELFRAYQWFHQLIGEMNASRGIDFSEVCKEMWDGPQDDNTILKTAWRSGWDNFGGLAASQKRTAPLPFLSQLTTARVRPVAPPQHVGSYTRFPRS